MYIDNGEGSWTNELYSVLYHILSVMTLGSMRLGWSKAACFKMTLKKP